MTDQNKTDLWQDQGEMFHVDSPCVGICTQGPKGFCKGCLRSRVERFHWHEMSENQKHTVIQLCQSRKARIAARRNNRDFTLLQQDELFIDSDSQIDLFKR